MVNNTGYTGQLLETQGRGMNSIINLENDKEINVKGYSLDVDESLNNYSGAVLNQKISQDNKKRPGYTLPTSQTETEDDGFVMVKYKHRKYKPRAIIGTNKSRLGTDSLCGAERKLWLYIGRTGENTNEDVVLDYLKEKYSVSNFTCEKLVTKSRYPSFKVSAPFTLKESIENPSEWPEGVVVRRFTFRPDYQSRNDPEKTDFLVKNRQTQETKT